ncbi:MAG: Mu transposase C-terminal domain-containing protein [Sphingomonadales bacterium]|nr:Mu transposase C-terminal domain-containing protein [Sphingomonadales bacterium]MDE2171358.1 Mu transposase C-terminal domain-containing protein [Sphingomonadales bacterium]
MIPIGAAAPEAEGPTDWFSLSDLLEHNLPDLPRDRRKLSRKAQDDGWHLMVDGDGQLLSRTRSRVGGGVEYHVSLLPPAAQMELAKRGLSVSRPRPAEAEPANAKEWRWYDCQTAKVKSEAERRAALILDIDTLESAGLTRSAAVAEVCRQSEVGASTMWNWLKSVAGVAPHDRLPFLAPRRKGGGAEADIPEDIWKVFLTDYLRPERPTLKSCYDRAVKIAEAQRLNQRLPSDAAFRRRLKRDVDARVLLMRRGGKDEFKRSVPDVRRTLDALQVLDIVNIDGHVFDVFVIPPGGTEEQKIRPVLIGIQDVYSRKILAWKLDVSENFLATRMAFADLFRNYGIPKQCLLDNSRTFAGKQLTGGTENRYRHKHKEGEALGLLPALGIQVRFAQIYHGQAKPIERAWRDMADRISRGPECAGAYTGNSPANKPANYGERAIPWDEFCGIVDRGIADHNARTGRRAGVCNGRSFDQVFAESYTTSAISRATPEQLRVALLTSELKRVHKRTGEVELYGNRYWSEECGRITGEQVTVRFDPDDLTKEIYLYNLRGEFLFAAMNIENRGFNDVAGAHESKKRRQDYRRAVKAKEEAEELLTITEVAAMNAAIGAEVSEMPQPAATRMVRHRTSAAVKIAPDPQRQKAAQEHAQTRNQLLTAMNRFKVVE